MTSIETAQPERDVKKRSMLTKLAAGSLVVAGLLAAAIAPASADNDWHGHGKHHNKHWKHNHGNHYGHYYKPRPPKVVYYQPAPVYYAPPPPVYYQPAPVYYYPEHRSRVSVDLVFPIRID